MRGLRKLVTGPDRAAGMTLVEVLTAMIILGIVLSLVTNALIGALHQQSNISQQTQAQNTNNAGMELMTRLLRQSVTNYNPPANTSIVTYADPTKIIFTSRLSGTSTASSADNTPVNAYVFALPSGSTSLQWGQASCPSTGACTATPTPSHTIVTGVRNASGSTACSANTTGTGVFRYYWINQGTPTELTVQAGQTSLTATQLAEIQYIEIDLYTATKTGPSAPACDPLQDYVELRN
jgi:prepilin-type N-terminal cleavage/methylation domain-containing protein